jgi:hypothetical protein
MANRFRSSGIATFEKVLQKSLIGKEEDLILVSAKNKIEKAASDLMTYLELEISSLTMPLDNLERLLLEFEQYLQIVEVKKRELSYVIQGRAKEIANTLDEDLTIFKKDNENKLAKRVENFADEKFKDKHASSKTVVTNSEDYLKKTLIEIYSEFIRTEDLKLQKQFQDLVNEAEEKTNALVSNVRHKAAKLFGFQVENVVLTSSLDFKTKFYYHLDPIFTAIITFSSGEVAELLPKSIFKGFLNKKLAERVKSEFDKNGGRIRYDYFVTRLDQAVLKLKRDINRTLLSSTESVNQAVHEAEQLHIKGQEEVKNKVNELLQMQSQLQDAREQLAFL